MSTVTLPSDINGVVEAGIAAGVDDFTQTGYQLTVRLKATGAAPAQPSAAEIRAASLVREWSACTSDSDRLAIYTDEEAIKGTVPGVGTAGEVTALIDNWPASEGQIVANISAGDATKKVREYENWINTDADIRPHLEVDMNGTLLGMAIPGSNSIARKLYQSMVVYILQHGWVIRREVAANGLLRYVGPEVAVVAARTVEEVENLGWFPMQKAVNLIVAAKVTWWLINHHVGQIEGKIESYAGKVAAVEGLTSTGNIAQVREVRAVIWAVSKMVPTRGILSALGIAGIAYEDRSNNRKASGNDYARCGIISIGSAQDIKDRISAYPAGSAKLATNYAIAIRAVNSVFGVCVPPLVSLRYDKETSMLIGDVMDKLEDAKAQPARYHMGSEFLTGYPKLESDVWTEEEKSNLASFIHATAPNSSLAKASCIVRKEEVTDNIVYSTILSVKQALADKAGGDLSLLLIGRLGGGTIAGGMATQFGKLSEEEALAATEDYKLISEGPVEPDEPPPAGKETARAKADREARNAARAARRAARARAGLSD